MDGHGGGGGGSSNSPPPFVTKTYEMVDDPSTNAIVSWSASNSSFVVWNQAAFARDLLPKYFKHNNFSSFVRQLNTYGFGKIDTAMLEFANEDFVRGKKHLLKNIHRRKATHSHSLPLGLVDPERKELEEKICRLKHDKVMLISELQEDTQQRHGMEQHMEALEERLHNVNLRHKNMITFLTQIVQRPEFLSKLVEQSDIHSKKRRLPRGNLFSADTDIRENSDVGSTHFLKLEQFEKMESSLNSLENFFRDVGEASGEDMYYDSTGPCFPSSAVISEIETDGSTRSHSPSLGDIHVSPEMNESTNNVESPLPFAEISTETRNQVSEIDVNDEPVVTVASNAPSGVNDVFWEQFLTEVPGSERREANKERSEACSIWRTSKNVENLMNKMGHLASAEKA